LGEIKNCIQDFGLKNSVWRAVDFKEAKYERAQYIKMIEGKVHCQAFMNKALKVP